MKNIQDSNYEAIRQEIIKRAEKMPLLESSRQILSGTKKPNESITIEFSTEDIYSVDKFRKKHLHKKLIFIVTTIFNDTSFYRKTLESVWNQEDAKLPVVYLVKDASTSTDCIDLLKEYIKHNIPIPEKFTCMYWHKPDKSMYEGLRQAFEFIQSIELHDKTVTTYINADDVLMPYSSRIASDACKYNNIEWLTGPSRVINEEDSVLCTNQAIFSSKDILNHINDGRSGPFIQQEGTYWTLGLYKQSKGFNSNLKLAGDYDLWQKFAKLTDIFTLDKPLGSFRKRKGQKSENILNYYQELDDNHTTKITKEGPKWLRKHNNPRTGYVVVSDMPYSIEKRIQIWNSLSRKVEYCSDPLFCYTKSLSELKSIHNKKEVFPSILRDEEDVHLGIASFGITHDPEGYNWYTTVKGSSRWEEINYFFEQKIEKLGILSIRILAINCSAQAELIICANNLERRLMLSGTNTFKTVNKVIDMDLVMNFRNSSEAVIGYKLIGADFCFVSINNYSYMLPNDFNEYGYIDKRFEGWPYFSNQLKPQYSSQYLERLPSVSVIVPTFNQGNTIRDTLASLYSQHYPKLQVIVLDGQSNDSTREVLKDFLGFISEIRSWDDDGQSAAIAEGITMATGDIVTWLNTDDLCAPLTLFKVAQAYLKDDKPDIIAGNCYAFRDKDYKWIHSCQIWKKTLDPSQILDVKNYWLRGKYFHQPEVFFTRSAINKVEKYCNEEFINSDLYYSMDYDIWAKMALSGCNIHKINTVTAMYRLTEEQKTSSVDNYLPELLAHSNALSKKYNIDFDLDKSENNSAITSWSQFKVLLFNDVGFYGGAGIAHERIGKSLKLYDVDIQCISASDNWSDEGHFIDIDALRVKLDQFQPDLVICGNIHGIKNNHLEILSLLSSSSPCWFIVHDYWITNGVHPYPSLDSKEPLSSINLASHEWIRAINELSNLSLLPNSAYCKETLSLCKFKRIISSDFHLSLDTTQTDTKCATMEFIPEKPLKNKIRIALGSVGLLEERKGASVLLDALKLMPQNILADITFDSYGFNALEKINDYCEYNHHGFLGQESIRELLKTADIYINTSKVETFGQTSLESIDFGMICLSNENGGSSEMITNGNNSLIFEMTAESLALVLSDVHDSLLKKSIQLDCQNKLARSLSVSNFSSQSQGYSLLKTIVNCGHFSYPIGGQKVKTSMPSELELKLEIL